MASPRKKSPWLWRALALLPVPALWCALAHFGALDFLENRLIDLRFRWRGELAAPAKVVYVDVDTLSLDEIGGWPWDRKLFAQVCQALTGPGGAKAVGLDFVFSDLGQPQVADRAKLRAGNQEFYRFLLQEPPVMLAASFAGDTFRDESGAVKSRALPRVTGDPRAPDDIEPPELPQFDLGRGTVSPAGVGLIDALGGGIRWVPLYAPTNVQTYRHLSVELSRLYLGVSREGVKISADQIELVRDNGTVAARIPLAQQQDLEINWFSPWIAEGNPRTSFSTALVYAEVLADAAAPPAEKAVAEKFFAQFKDAIVLIGPVDKLLQDLAPTPFDEFPVPRVGLHGNAVKTILSGQYLSHPPEAQRWGIVFALTFLVTGLAVAGGARGVTAKVVALLAVAGYALVGFHLFATSHLVLPLAAPLGAAFTTSFLAVGWQLIAEEQAKGRLRRQFGTYLAPELVSRMAESGEDPQLGGHEEVITAYFSDIQSFSTFSELMPPAQLVELMNEYLTLCTDLVQEERGTLDKYIGDAVVAIYGAPLPLSDHAFRACTAAIRVQQGIERLRQKWRAEGDKWPPIVHHLRARLGLNTGPAIVGNMGSRSRFSYTMMGDNVNLAARMESGAKSLGVFTMVTEATKLECEKHSGDKIVFRFLDKIIVKGRTLPVPVHEVVGFRAELAQPTADCLGLHAQAMARYLAQDWDGALALFTQSAALEPHQPDKTRYISSNPSLLMQERCRHMKAHPPPSNWDGAYTMTEK